MGVDSKRNTFVVDASIILAKLLPDEKQLSSFNNRFSEFVDGRTDFIAPTLLKYEVVNGIRSGVLQKRLGLKLALQIYLEFIKLPIIYIAVDLRDVLTLSIDSDISVYDGTYVYLAKKEKLELLTLDKKLQKLNTQDLKT
jgi:predicted nucleic acid-binding protein